MAKPWQPQGNVHTLGESAITRLVPAVSGVYGLHNAHQQLFIGEAADLREALLLHWQESENLFRGRQPTHFSFEACDANTRAQRAQRLIAEHQPAIQALQLLSLAALPSEKSKRHSITQSAAGTGDKKALPQWPQAAWPSDAEPQAKYFSRAQLATLAALFIASASALGYLGVVTGQKIGARRVAALESAAARRPVLAYVTAEAAQAGGSDTVSGSSDDTNSDAKLIEATQAAATGIPLPPIQVVSAPSPEGDAATAIAKQAVALTPAASQEPAANSWSVQIASTQDEKAAHQLQDKLKNQGYDAFIVEADLNSALWYRVRIGRFGAQQEAEAARQMLQSKENIRSAFVTAK